VVEVGSRTNVHLVISAVELNIDQDGECQQDEMPRMDKEVA
jgi:hypothetical protein